MYACKGVKLHDFFTHRHRRKNTVLLPELQVFEVSVTPATGSAEDGLWMVTNSQNISKALLSGSYSEYELVCICVYSKVVTTCAYVLYFLSRSLYLCLCVHVYIYIYLRLCVRERGSYVSVCLCVCWGAGGQEAPVTFSLQVAL